MVGREILIWKKIFKWKKLRLENDKVYFLSAHKYSPNFKMFLDLKDMTKLTFWFVKCKLLYWECKFMYFNSYLILA